MAKANVPDPRRHLPSVHVRPDLPSGACRLRGVLIDAACTISVQDAPHSRLVYNALDELRDRAIARYSSDIKSPSDLNDPKRIAAGAGLYSEMCTGCHLGPGLEKSELSQVLYPAAPELARW